MWVSFDQYARLKFSLNQSAKGKTKFENELWWPIVISMCTMSITNLMCLWEWFTDRHVNLTKRTYGQFGNFPDSWHRSGASKLVGFIKAKDCPNGGQYFCTSLLVLSNLSPSSNINHSFDESTKSQIIYQSFQTLLTWPLRQSMHFGSMEQSGPKAMQYWEERM